jgi:hypothetical protein
MAKRYAARTSLKDNRLTSLGMVPEEWRETPPAGYAGQLMNLRQRILPTCQHYHSQLEKVIDAKLRWQEPKIPDVPVRKLKVHEHQRKLAELRKQYNAIGAQAVNFEIERLAIQYSERPVDVSMRGEMRTALRNADDRKKQELLKDRSFREAALEGPAALSGLQSTAHNRLRNDYIAENFGPELKVVQEYKQAAEIIGQTFKAAEAAIQAELVALDEPAVEGQQPPSKPHEPWE